jgi:hypothetical protein
MSYPAPTKGLWPERSIGRPQQVRAQYITKVDEFRPYPEPTTGVGIPVKFAPVEPISLFAGETHQLIPALLDIEGNLQTATERLRYVSNTPTKILVSDSGMISTNIPASQHSRRGSAVTATIQIHYGGINTFVPVVVRTDFNDIVSD